MFLLLIRKQSLKKALISSAFFVCILLQYQTALAGNCSTHNLSSPEKATVKWVYDGDTLLLTDKRKIRVIGIDTPEVKHHQQESQAYSAKAKEALRELLKKYHYKVILQYGKEREDRYSRTLAHVFTPDGINISTWLLEKGFAKILSYPPNVQLANCYRQSEQYAQRNRLRLWSLQANDVISSFKLGAKVKGYVRLKGKIRKIRQHNKSVTLELESHFKNPIQLKISKKHRQYFKNFNLDKLWDRTIIISGVLSISKNHKRRSIRVRHPTQIQVIHTQRIAPTIEWSSNNEN